MLAQAASGRDTDIMRKGFTMTDDHRAVVEAAAAMMPAVAALSGWPHINPTTVRGLLQSAAEARGLPVTPNLIGDLEEATLRGAFPHVVELRKGPWFDRFPAFVRANVNGTCSAYPVPWTDEDLQATPVVTRYLVFFSEEADAAACIAGRSRRMRHSPTRGAAAAHRWRRWRHARPPFGTSAPSTLTIRRHGSDPRGKSQRSAPARPSAPFDGDPVVHGRPSGAAPRQWLRPPSRTAPVP
jgi:hypothetical protein